MGIMDEAKQFCKDNGIDYMEALQKSMRGDRSVLTTAKDMLAERTGIPNTERVRLDSRHLS